MAAFLLSRHSTTGISYVKCNTAQNLKTKAERPRNGREIAGPVEPDGRPDWRTQEGLSIILSRATAFAERDMRMGADGAGCAQDAVSGVWEDVKFGRILVEDTGAFQREVSARLYRIAASLRNQSRKTVSFDAPLPGKDGDANSLLDVGFKGKIRATQIDAVYLSELHRGFTLLPDKLRRVMVLLAAGWNAADVATELHVPIHTVFRRISDARRALFANDLMGMGGDLNL